MTVRPGNRRQIFVLDTNVLMHDPGAIYRFQEHDVFLPMVVLEELDAAKKGVSEVARNVRQVTRMLDDLIEEACGRERPAIGVVTQHKPEIEDPTFDATASIVEEDAEALLDRMLEVYGEKYPDEIGKWSGRFKKGLADGSRVIIRYEPA